jgi:hypothetical protein
MACEFFDDGRLARCSAVCGLLIPTLHERERYCRGDENAACPTYRLRQELGEPIPQSAYYALWLAPAPTPAEGEPAPPPVVVV